MTPLNTYHLARAAGAALLLTPIILLAAAAAPRIEVVAHEAARRVDVTIDGKPFTSYIWPVQVKKPVLYPLRSAKGTLVTRGWPIDPLPGEPRDHPHLDAMRLNYT